jgi:hypothetical protein
LNLYEWASSAYELAIKKKLLGFRAHGACVPWFLMEVDVLTLKKKFLAHNPPVDPQVNPSPCRWVSAAPCKRLVEQMKS